MFFRTTIKFAQMTLSLVSKVLNAINMVLSICNIFGWGVI